MRFERRFVLGVPVDITTESDVLSFVRHRVEGRVPAQIATVNAEFVILAQRDAVFRRVLATAALTTADGAGVVWALRRQGADQRRRVGGSDLVWTLSQEAARRGWRVFFLGGAPGVAEEAARRLGTRFPGLNVAGAHAGSPFPSDQGAIVDLIRQSRADLLFVAFGAPAQELWIARVLPETGVSVAIGIGGSLDYVAGRARRAPRWMQDRGLDWLWRLIRQPWRWRRMLALPRFAVLVLRENRSEDGT